MMLPSKGTYDCRDEIKRVGGKFDASARRWSVTPAQLAMLREMAETSANRFNKRDTQFGRSWAVVEAGIVSVGARVETGEGADHDTGTVRQIADDRAEVAWDSGVTGWAPVDSMTIVA